MGKRGQVVGHENDQRGLEWIYRFGWLRAKELAEVMWPKSASKVKNAEHLLRKWQQEHLNYVICRVLPCGAGSAYVLSARGAQFLRDNGIESAVTGKDWGEIKNSKWLPPRDWKHTLMAHYFLASRAFTGCEIYPEYMLRRQHPGLKKIPDGLLVKRSDKQIEPFVAWIEVENQRKSGKPMEKMATFLVEVCSGEAPKIANLRATTAIVVYDPHSTDEKGHHIDHKIRVKNAVAAVAKDDISLFFAAMYRSKSGFNVERIDFSEERIEASTISRTLKELDWADTKKSHLLSEYISEKYCILHGFLLQVYQLRHPKEEQTWYCEFSEEVRIKNAYQDNLDWKVTMRSYGETEKQCEGFLIELVFDKLEQGEQAQREADFYKEF